MVLELCDNVTALEVIRIVQTAIRIIKISIPIILIVTIMVDFMGCVTSGKDDEIRKTLKSSAKKFIAAAFIFLLPTFVNIIFSIGDNDTNYCLTEKVTLDSIKQAKIENVESLISRFMSTKSLNDYYNALNAVYEIDDESTQSTYLNELENIKSEIDNN